MKNIVKKTMKLKRGDIVIEYDKDKKMLKVIDDENTTQMPNL